VSAPSIPYLITFDLGATKGLTATVVGKAALRKALADLKAEGRVVVTQTTRLAPERYEVRPHGACGCDTDMAYVLWDTGRGAVVQHFKRSKKAQEVADLGNRLLQLGMGVVPR
jgi:hypothetical protein